MTGVKEHGDALGGGGISPFRLVRDLGGWTRDQQGLGCCFFCLQTPYLTSGHDFLFSHSPRPCCWLTCSLLCPTSTLPAPFSYFSYFLRQAGQTGGEWKGQRKSERGPGGWCRLPGEHLKSLPLKKSQAEVWHSTSRPSVGLSIIDFSQNSGGVESSPREVMNFSASWNIFSGFQCCGEEQVRGARPKGVEQAGADGGQALTWIRMIFVMSSGGLSGKGRTRSKILTQD